jgi:hypothetical protein
MVSTHTLKSWSEAPRTLAEEMAFEAVRTWKASGKPIDWNGPTKEPFLSLQAEGWVKEQFVLRLSDGNVTVHFWQAMHSDSRLHIKVMTS